MFLDARHYENLQLDKICFQYLVVQRRLVGTSWSSWKKYWTFIPFIENIVGKKSCKEVFFFLFVDVEGATEEWLVVECL